MKTDSIDTSKSYETMDMEQVIRPRDSVKLIANYRDPFLGIKQTQVKNDILSRPNSKKKAFVDKQKKEIQVQWPEVIYGGVIINSSNSENTAMVKINGKEYLVRTGQKLNGLEFLSVYKDSLIVEFKKAQKTIIKN